MRRVLPIVLMLFGLTAFGAVGFRLVSGASWIDCAYMAVITLTTVGYEEAVPLSDAGKIFVIGYLMVGISTFTYSAFQLGQWIVGLRLSPQWRKQNMESKIKNLKGHYIVCGYGRMGQATCKYLQRRSEPFVIVDQDAERLSGICEEHNWLFMPGDATDDDILAAAGIDRAKAIAVALHSDADNLYVVLSARMLNRSIQIISRASDEAAVKKIKRAGADRVISPFGTAGARMARMMLQPSLEDFLQIADDRGSGLELADIVLAEDSPYIGKTLGETDLRKRGVMVVGIRRANGQQLMPPPSSARLEVDDRLFTFGTADAVSDAIDEA